jgi:hypothetical protein
MYTLFVRPKAPLIDVLIARDGAGWRLYSAPGSWRGPLSRLADARGGVAGLGQPDLADLEEHMFSTDAPYERRLLHDGGVELVAKGRSAVCLAVWLQSYVAASGR